MNWQSYEETVKDIYEQLGAANIEILGWGSDCKVRGKSGVNHQIDVLTSHSDGIHSYRTAIECKYWKDKVQKDAIAKLSEILEDAQIEKGVIVSKSGFTQDAQNFAKYKNIALVELREPRDEDWEGRIKDIHLNIHMLVPHIYDCELIQERTDKNDKSNPQRFGVRPSDVLIRKPDGNSTSLQEIINSKLRADAALEGRGDRAYSIPFPDGSSLSVSTNGARTPIKEIRFKVRYSETTEEIQIRGEDYVYMIMSAIFEKKQFVISPDGKVRASDTLLEE